MKKTGFWSIIFIIIICGGFFGITAADDIPDNETDVLVKQSLFNGVSLDGWQVSDFTGGGQVTVQDSTIIIEKGVTCSGIRWVDSFPRSDYEVTLDAKRIEGNDFFCGMTFPVGEEYCSLIISGWGGTVVGLSCIDGRDASENATGMMKRFTQDRWYHIRLRVTTDSIQAWIDSQQVVNFVKGEQKLSLRAEVLPSRPFGIATWKTTGALKRIFVQVIQEK
ncbi:MAG TPA: DUF1080 domain-containing protein [bacterium]|nr:DUF1080 domain-containing protein [bacterium]HPN44456.1 DUF1080 domain-containing protein [bacterium]